MLLAGTYTLFGGWKRPYEHPVHVSLHLPVRWKQTWDFVKMWLFVSPVRADRGDWVSRSRGMTSEGLGAEAQGEGGLPSPEGQGAPGGFGPGPSP